MPKDPAVLADTPPGDRLDSAKDSLGVLAALARLHPGGAVYLVPGYQTPLPDALHRSKSRYSIGRICRRIKVRDPREPRPCSRFSAAIRRNPGRHPDRICERVDDGAQANLP